MGLKLRMLELWTPNYVIKRELRNVSSLTSNALKTLAATHAPNQLDAAEQKAPRSIQEQRAAMAQAQAELVQALEETLGHKEAVRVGREALFAVGQDLGRQTRAKLGVTDKPEDLVRAAKILYRILGINFHLEWVDQSVAVAVIDRCALSQQYSKLTCEVLSATDEGVINGLQPKVNMKFTQYMTSGCQNCRAEIHFNQKENRA